MGDETEEAMPLTVVLAHKLNQRMADLRRNGTCKWLRPDSKTQVTCEYSFKDGACIPKRVHTVVISVQHDEHIQLETMREILMTNIIKEAIPAKYMVKAGLCKRVLVQIAYAIGIAEPLSITVFSYGTSTKSEQELLKIVKENFDLRPGKIVKDLQLKNPIYQKTSSYGHFGRDGFTWETPKQLKF